MDTVPSVRSVARVKEPVLETVWVSNALRPAVPPIFNTPVVFKEPVPKREPVNVPPPAFSTLPLARVKFPRVNVPTVVVPLFANVPPLTSPLMLRVPATVAFPAEKEVALTTDCAFTVRVPPPTAPKVTRPPNSVIPSPVSDPRVPADRKRSRPALSTLPSTASRENCAVPAMIVRSLLAARLPVTLRKPAVTVVLPV